jgi:two-component system sensor histidine kinase DesK
MADPTNGPVRTAEPGAGPPSAPPESAGRLAAVAFSGLLVIPVKDLLESDPSPVRLGLVLAGVGAFAVVFLWRLAFARVAEGPGRSLALWVGVALALAVALVVGDGPERWAPLFIFVSAVIGVRIPLPWAAYGIGACTAASVMALAPTAPVDNTLAVALQALALGALTVAMRRLRSTVLELHEAREQLARLAVTEERLRFARDLHDLVGHSLSLIALKADLARRLFVADPDRAAKEVADIDVVARDALAEVRQAVSGYRQPTLAQAVATGRMALEAAGIEASWDIARVAFPEDLDTALGWAVREAITNVIRHSRAHRCSVRVTAGLVEAAAEVVDDGSGPEGADATAAPAVGSGALPPWAGNGLSGLGERLQALGGRLEVARRPEGGVRLRASVPTPASVTAVSA